MHCLLDVLSLLLLYGKEISSEPVVFIPKYFGLLPALPLSHLYSIRNEEIEFCSSHV